MTNGYDPSSGLYLATTLEFDKFHIAEEPRSADLEVALERIRDVIGEFPFVDQASFANVLATMLTAVCRHILDGPTPLALFDATTAGTGKTLLAEVISLIVAGRPAELFTAPREPEEWRKQLTSVLREGPGVVVIDNVGTRLDAPELCKVLTADVHSDRLLGKSQTVSLPVRCTWIATGNNLRLGGDIPRRCYWIRMEAPCSEPFKRTGFRHPHLKTYVLKQRVQLLAALLTLARGWFVAGRPSATIAPLGSYEHWTEVVGGILQHAGVDGFLGNIEQLHQQADTESAAWETFLLTLHAVFASQPFTVGELWDKLNERTTDLTTSLSRSANELRAALPSELMRWIDQQGPFKQRLGMAFSERRGRRFGKSQIRIEQGTQDTHAKVASWSVLAGS